MKKLLLQIAFTLLFIPAFSQGFVSVSGTVTNMANGNPVPNHAVTILSDSTAGFTYYNVVYTNTSGFYIDTVFLTMGGSGTLFIQTLDCNNILHQDTWNYTPNQVHTSNFAICVQPSFLPVVITGSANGISSVGAMLHGSVNPNGDQTSVNFEFGTTTAYGTYLSCGYFNGNTMQPVAEGLYGLTPGTLYHYRITGSNSFGDAYGADSTFTTLPLDAPPTAITENATNIVNDGAVIHGLYNANGYSATKVLEWGLTSTYGSFTSEAASGYADSPMQIGIYGLLPNTTYHYRAYIIYGGGTVYGNDSTFTTLGSTGCHAAFTFTPDSSNLVQFHDASTGNPAIVSWSWNFGDPASGPNNISYVQNPMHVYTLPGTYTACLTVHGSDSTCFDMTCKSVVVGNGGTCHAEFTDYADSINTGKIHFVDSSTAGTGYITTWIWNFGDGQVQTITFPANPNVTHTYATSGTYTVCLTIQGSDSTCIDNICHAVVVGNISTCLANFTWSVPASTSSPTQFTDLSQAGGGGPVTSWYWNFGDPVSGVNGTSTLQNPTHTFILPGTYTVCLTIHGADSSCYDMICKNVVVAGDTVCQANFTYYHIAPAMSTIHFTDSSTGNPTAWQWSFGDGLLSTVQNPVHLFLNPGTYTVCLTITGNNCTSTSCQDVVVQGTNVNVYGQVFAGNFPVSVGTVIMYSFDSVTNNLLLTGFTPVDSNGVYYFPAIPTGYYYILALPADSNAYLPTYYGNSITWEQATLIILGTPANPYNINLVPSGPMTPGPGSASGQINMGDVCSQLRNLINVILEDDQGNPIGYTGVSSSGAFSFPSLAYGTYLLHPELVRVTSDNIMIVLSPEKPHADVVMTFTGNNILGIHDMASMVNQWSVYPNPVNDNLTISLDLMLKTGARVGIYNMTGQLMYDRAVSLREGYNKIEISTSSLPAGIYSLRIFSAEGLNISTRVVKIK